MRTVLFGLDGATYSVLDPLMKAGVMPRLSEFCKSGVRARLLSTEMPITPQAWTSMATGRGMGHHGINDFVRVEVKDGKVFPRYNTSLDIKCETFWQYASRSGRRATVINYIAMAPPKPINGHSIPGFTPARHLRRSSFPPDLFTRLQAAEGVNIKILGLDFEVEKAVLSSMPEAEWLPWISHHIEREKAWFSAFEWLLVNEPSDISAIVLDGVDKIQHLAYRFLDPDWAPENPTPWESEVIEKCREYFALVDGFIGRTQEIIGKYGRMLIASDHGFTASTEIVYINNYLHQQGFLSWRGEFASDENESIYTDRLQDHLGQIDFVNTQAFALTPSCNGVFINVPDEQYHDFREHLIDTLFSLRGPDGGQVITKVKKREEAFPGDYSHFAPDLTLELRDFGLISVLKGPACVIPRSQPWGTHHPDGVLIASGPGIRANAQVDRKNIVDVTALMAHSIGLEIPAEYDGVFPADIFDPEYLRSDPPRVGASKEQGDLKNSSETGDDSSGEASSTSIEEQDEQFVLERLKSLGYL